ncbi:DUF6962 family protein [Arsenicibacter rosenii]|uniref:Uncharacterized protein n=1 Tax=Arsenicibacter rosenii TaxID=1750698 RepID=A0A1S2VJE1_9BACT|nr:hypothetical protein [Arsenicibacter rosenii]OIN58881.1 hypothetical protein BLX24_11680 [Arsenicibacter rosenii]
MILSNVISDAVLACTGIGVFWHYHQQTPIFNRLLWGFFFLLISLTALVGIFRFAGFDGVIRLHESAQLLAGSLGVVCVVMAVWALVRRVSLGIIAFAVSLIIGLFLFFILLLPQVAPFAKVVASLGILIVMLLGVYGLLQRDIRSVWIIAAVMIMALATKTPSLPRPINPVDFYHYALVCALLCFGKATQRIE